MWWCLPDAYLLAQSYRDESNHVECLEDPESAFLLFFLPSIVSCVLLREWWSAAAFVRQHLPLSRTGWSRTTFLASVLCPAPPQVGSCSLSKKYDFDYPRYTERGRTGSRNTIVYFCSYMYYIMYF